MIILGKFLANETVKYSEVFHDNDNTPADPSSPSARLLKPDDSASSLTTPAKIDSKTGWYGGSFSTTGFNAGTHRIYMTGTVSTHSVSIAFEFEIVTSISVATPGTRKYSGVFHNDDNTPADPTSPSARLLKPDGTLADLTTPAKLDSKTGWYGGSIDAAAYAVGCYQVYLSGTVSAHVIVAIYHFQVRAAASTPGTPEMTDLTAGDTEVVVALTADNESDVVYARYRLPDGDWAAESETFKRTGSGNITITGLTNGQRYQIGIYVKSGDLTSDWDTGYTVPTDGVGNPELSDLDDSIQADISGIILTGPGSRKIRYTISGNEAVEIRALVDRSAFSPELTEDGSAKITRALVSISRDSDDGIVTPDYKDQLYFDGKDWKMESIDPADMGGLHMLTVYRRERIKLTSSDFSIEEF